MGERTRDARIREIRGLRIVAHRPKRLLARLREGEDIVRDALLRIAHRALAVPKAIRVGGGRVLGCGWLQGLNIRYFIGHRVLVAQSLHRLGF